MDNPTPLDLLETGFIDDDLFLAIRMETVRYAKAPSGWAHQIVESDASTQVCQHRDMWTCSPL